MIILVIIQVFISVIILANHLGELYYLKTVLPLVVPYLGIPLLAVLPLTSPA